MKRFACGTLFLCLTLPFAGLARGSDPDAALTGEKEAPGGRPCLQIREPSYDHGNIWQGGTFTHEFSYKNVGDATLEITRVQKFCGCTRAEAVPNICPPQAEGNIIVTYNSAHRQGRITQRVQIDSNDPENASQQVTISVEVLVPYTVQPQNLTLNRVRKGTRVIKDIRFSSNHLADLQILAATPSHPFLEYEVIPLKGLPEGAPPDSGADPEHPGFLSPNEKSAVVLRMTLDTSELECSSWFRGWIDVATNAERSPTQRVQVSGHVVGDLVLSPDRIHFSNLSPNSQYLREISLINNDPADPAHVLSLECADSRIEIATEEVRAGINYRIFVTLKTGEEIGNGASGTITVRTDHPGQPQLVLPYMVLLDHPTIRRSASYPGP